MRTRPSNTCYLMPPGRALLIARYCVDNEIINVLDDSPEAKVWLEELKEVKSTISWLLLNEQRKGNLNENTN